MARKDLHDAMNEHLSKELYSAYLYLSMAAYFESVNLPGMTTWMRAQAKEEYQHAMLFWEHISDRGARVTLLALDKPPSGFTSPLDAFQQALDHEKEVTKEINELYAQAAAASDYASQAFLQGFVTEQVEEEKTATQIVDTLKMVGDNSAALLMFDRELGQRQSSGAPA